MYSTNTDVMKKQIRIQTPCPENWDHMQNTSDGKFCEKCSKCVVDFTDKTDEQVEKIIGDAGGREICGRISIRSLSVATAGIVLITNLTFIQAQTKSNPGVNTEQKIDRITKVSGKLTFKRAKKGIADAEVFFICKSKYIKTKTDKDGNFVLNIPNDLIRRKNVLYFSFNQLNDETYKNLDRAPSSLMNGDIYENTSVIFTKKEQIKEREFQIDSQHAYVGGIAVMEERPPDYYYFDGKSISKNKFEKLKKGNPDYQFFTFNGKEAEVIAGKNYLETVQLLFSK